MYSSGEGSGNNYAYLVIDDKTKEATIIDPANPPEVLPVLKKQVDSGAIKLKNIMNTHQYVNIRYRAEKNSSDLGSQPRGSRWW